MSAKKKEKTKNEEYIGRKMKKDDNNHNDMVKQLKKRDIYNKNNMDEDTCSCRYRHIEQNVYQNNLENMIGHGQLVATTFGKCICENDCQECTKKCRKSLNIPIFNIDEDCHVSDKCEETVIYGKFNLVPCLSSHKGCFISRK